MVLWSARMLTEPSSQCILLSLSSELGVEGDCNSAAGAGTVANLEEGDDQVGVSMLMALTKTRAGLSSERSRVEASITENFLSPYNQQQKPLHAKMQGLSKTD